VGYANWHKEPGYLGDVTRHFASDGSILDVGCGIAWLADHFENYTGIDSSPEMVESAVARGRTVLLGNVEKGLPFPDSSFDGVVAKDLLEHVDDPVAVVREVARVLKPGGRVFASSPDAQRWVWDDYTHRRPFTRKSYRLLFADEGFEVEDVGYESVMPGTSVLSGWTRRKRRPRILRALAWVPFVRRNVWVLARRSHESATSDALTRRPR
jgi:SAM-dependent methyltransferase